MLVKKLKRLVAVTNLLLQARFMTLSACTVNTKNTKGSCKTILMDNQPLLKSLKLQSKKLGLIGSSVKCRCHVSLIRSLTVGF